MIGVFQTVRYFNNLCLKGKFWNAVKKEVSSDRIAYITLSNAKKRNPLQNQVLQELLESIYEVSQQFKKVENYPKAIVIQSEGPVFSAGHDLKELASQTEQENLRTFQDCSKIMTLIRKSDLPVIASVQGLATAAGCQLVAACDLVVASNLSTFSTPGVKIGLACTTPGVSLARSLTSTKKAFEMIVTGDTIDAREAQIYGLVNQIVSDNGDINILREETKKFVHSIIQHSSETIAMGKRAFYKQVSINDLEQAYEFASIVMTSNLQIDDCKEGLNAFLNKRKPEFKN